jgi:hypothetical protein
MDASAVASMLAECNPSWPDVSSAGWGLHFEPAAMAGRPRRVNARKPKEPAMSKIETVASNPGTTSENPRELMTAELDAVTGGKLLETACKGKVSGRSKYTLQRSGAPQSSSIACGTLRSKP